MEEKRPLEQCPPLIHCYRNNPNNPDIFTHLQFLDQIPEVVSATMLQK
jgi:hypothetical protein